MQSEFQRKLNNFFSNRNGIDEIGFVCFGLNVVFAILWFFIPDYYIFLILELIAFGYCLFRIFSKNIYQRQKENTAFVNFFKKIFKRGTKSRPKRQKVIKVKKQKVKKEKVKKDKNYIYKVCPNCKSEIKIKKGKKGDRIVMCTKCYTETKFKI